MAGKNTSKLLHPSKLGHMVATLAVTNSDWQTLEEIAGCAFSPEQRDAIVDELTVCRDYRDYLSDMVSRQDVKRTLAAISKMKGANTLDAYSNCDAISDVLIYEAAWFKFGVNVLTCEDSALACETIAKAAAHVLENLPDSKGGRPTKGHHKRLARFCCELWAQCGNKPAANTWNGVPSPMVEFSRYIFDLVDDDLTDAGTIQVLLNDAGKVSPFR